MINGAVKPRPLQSRILLLPANQRERLHELFRANLTYKEIAAIMENEFGFSIAEPSLSRYYTRHAFEFMGTPEEKSSGQPLQCNIILPPKNLPRIVITITGSET